MGCCHSSKSVVSSAVVQSTSTVSEGGGSETEKQQHRSIFHTGTSTSNDGGGGGIDSPGISPASALPPFSQFAETSGTNSSANSSNAAIVPPTEDHQNPKTQQPQIRSDTFFNPLQCPVITNLPPEGGGPTKPKTPPPPPKQLSPGDLHLQQPTTTSGTFGPTRTASNVSPNRSQGRRGSNVTPEGFSETCSSLSSDFVSASEIPSGSFNSSSTYVMSELMRLENIQEPLGLYNGGSKDGLFVSTASGDAPSKGDRLMLSQDAVVKMTHEIVRGFDNDGNKFVNEYSVIALLGQGSFAKVKLAIDTRQDKPVAIKILKLADLEKDHDRRRSMQPSDQSPRHSQTPKTPLELVIQEIEIMKLHRHPNLVKLINVIQDPTATKLYMVLEYMEGGVLTKTPSLSSPPELPQNSVDFARVRASLQDVIHGLQFLHRKGVIHMDIKPENILKGKDGVCKLADFGVCSVLCGNMESTKDILTVQQGTPLFFAPEMVFQDNTSFHGKATDVWALGVTLYVLVYNRLPFPGPTMSEYYEGVQHNEVVFPTLSSCVVPEMLIDVLRRTLEKEPALRITVDQLATHPFFVEKEKIPLRWWTRCWREHKVAMCKDKMQRRRLVTKLQSNVEEGEGGIPYCQPDLAERRLGFFLGGI